ncbi:unnamed protein product [Rotaria sordida]|uniref:RING-type domain-containing protein n=1 Tax=Rotaria sordida TaxID=392033 RepID=A0A815KDD6_9BILA|nr:unnamed protein product [Rotaria sordida]
MSEYSKTPLYYEKVLEVRQQALPPNHPHLTVTYNSIAPHAKLKYERIGTQKIKCISFGKTGPSISKNNRIPVKLINSRLSTTRSRSTSRSTTNNSDTIEDNCQICYGNVATYEYDPCQHFPMCGECFAKLNAQQLEECFYCRRPATIHSHVPM